MLDANTELNRLRQALRFKNFSESLVNEIINDASKEISIATSDILADAMSQAVNVGGEIMSTDFINELKSIRSGSSFDIVTSSGRTDFSEPPFPMLPKLLKNAKVAKDGSLYKVIPIRQSSGKTRNKVVVTTEAALQNINEARYKAKEEREIEKESDRSLSFDPLKGGDTFITAMNLNTFRNNGSSSKRERSNEPIVAFRTASSKQDANTQWVNPGRSANVGGRLREINMNMNNEIDNAIKNIVRKYEDMY